MRPHAYLVLLFALHARAASIQTPSVPELQKKIPVIPNEPAKDTFPIDNVSSEQELIDSANTIKDVENNLRVKAIDSIPVKVIVDEVDETPEEVDLNNPGEPQRQEHNTQNPESHGHEQQIVSTVKQTVSDTQAALKQGFQGVTQGLQDWISNNEQLSSIQQSIQGLQQSFNSHINKLNETIQSYLNNQESGDPVQPDQKQKPQFDNVENHLKTLEDNFKIGVKALSEGVQVFATLRDDNEKPTAPPNNLFLQYLQLFQQTVVQGFNNVTQAMQNYVGQNNPNNTASNGGIFQGLNNGIQNIFGQGGSTAAPDAQSDEAATSKPTIWQGIQSSIQNILNPIQTQADSPGQGLTPSAPNGPLAQAIQNNPFVQGVVNLIQSNKPQSEKPASQPAQEGSNSVPAAPTETKPEADALQPVKETIQQAVPNNNGPIKNIIQNNPIVKGISGAVQKLQSSINNPEKPRDTVKEEEPVKDDAKGHGGSGYNNDSSGISSEAEPEKIEREESVPEDTKKEDLQKKVLGENDKTETS